MGQKVHPVGMRLGIVKDWQSLWYSGSKDFAAMLEGDIKVREYLNKELDPTIVSAIKIERPARSARVSISSSRVGAILGRNGEGIEKLKTKISALMGIPVHITVEEVRKPELDAKLVSASIAQQLEKRVMFRRAMKRAVTSAMRLGAKGIKVCVSGRLAGAEIARTEWYKEGRVPLHTLRADIDYGFSEAHTTYGVIGVKVWIFKGEILGTEKSDKEEQKG